MRVSIIGTGYVGITTGVCLALKGHNVICVDKKESIVKNINCGKIHIYEPELERKLKHVIKNKRLEATMDTDYAVENTDITIITVGTPYNNGCIDLGYIKQAVWEIGETLKNKEEYHVVCVKSTVAPSTTDTIVKTQLEKASGKSVGDFGLAMNPEFLREGSAVKDFIYPDRIVIGAYDDKSYSMMFNLYSCFEDIPIIRVNLRTAELIKYASNSLLAMLISFSNEISNIAEQVGGIDITEVLSAVALDKRLNPVVEGIRVNPPVLEYLEAGCGFGGSCFPKDVNALITFAEQNQYNPQLLQSIVEINKEQPLRLVKAVEKGLGDIKDKKIAVLGVSFKANTDDIRESPALIIIDELMKKNAKVFVTDPAGLQNASLLYDNKLEVKLCRDYKECLTNADAAILVTPWKEYLNINPEEFKSLMKNPLIVDGRRVYDKKLMKNKGIDYMGIGLA